MIPVIPARLVTTGLILIVAAAALGYAYAQGRSDGAARARRVPSTARRSARRLRSATVPSGGRRSTMGGGAPPAGTGGR